MECPILFSEPKRSTRTEREPNPNGIRRTDPKDSILMATQRLYAATGFVPVVGVLRSGRDIVNPAGRLEWVTGEVLPM